MEKRIKVEGMSCMHCSNAVKEALMEISGVTSVEVSLENKEVVVVGEDLVNESLTKAIEDEGYTVHGIEG